MVALGMDGNTRKDWFSRCVSQIKYTRSYTGSRALEYTLDYSCTHHPTSRIGFSADSMQDLESKGSDLPKVRVTVEQSGIFPMPGKSVFAYLFC